MTSKLYFKLQFTSTSPWLYCFLCLAASFFVCVLIFDEWVFFFLKLIYFKRERLEERDERGF